MDATLLVQYKALSAPTLSLTRYFIFNLLIISLIFIENKCLYDAIWDWKGREKKSSARRWDRTAGRSRQKRHDLWFTICVTGADTSVDSVVLLVVLSVPWLTDVSSNQRWVIYSQPMALSQTIPTSSGLSELSLCFLTCYFVFEFVIVFSDLLFCFRICHCVFWLVIMFFGIVVVFSELLFCFLYLHLRL